MQSNIYKCILIMTVVRDTFSGCAHVLEEVTFVALSVSASLTNVHSPSRCKCLWSLVAKSHNECTPYTVSSCVVGGISDICE